MSITQALEISDAAFFGQSHTMSGVRITRDLVRAARWLLLGGGAS